MFAAGPLVDSGLQGTTHAGGCCAILLENARFLQKLTLPLDHRATRE
jgi:hypothetical protein